MRSTTPSQFTGMPLKLKETNQLTIAELKIPIGGRQTTLLFTSTTEEIK